MLAKRIIPCLDVDKGRVVKGVKFKELRDAGDPVDVAVHYNNMGADEIAFLDITASFEDREAMLNVIERTIEKVFIPVVVGGGIRTLEDIRNILLAGADKVSINTSAVKNPTFIKEAANRFGSSCIVAAIDAKRDSKYKWQVYTHGGRTPTGIDAIAWAKELETLGAGELLVTSMDKDGTKEGYDLELIKKISEEVSIPVIASGGVGTMMHIYEGLTIGKADAALAATIFHFREIEINELKRFLFKKGIPVRLDYER